MSYPWFNITGFRSTSNWEGSYWGGFKKVLWDHPEIKVKDGLEWENNHIGDLGYYNYGKLIKLFLLHAKNEKVGYYLMQSVKEKKITKWFKKYTRYTFSEHSVEKVADHLVCSGIELSNMFRHYRDIIEGTKFYYDIPEDQQGDGDQDGEGDSEQQGEGSGKGKENKKDRNDKDKGGGGKPDIQKILQEVFESIKEKKPYEPINNWYGGWGGESGSAPVFRIMSENDVCQYTPEESLYAGQLVNMLDISFDPAMDRIGSLKSGKLETMKLCEIASGNFNVYYRQEENITTRPFSVCVLMDESGSMGDARGTGHKAFYAVSMMKILYKAFSQIIPQDKMFFYGHSGDGTPMISVYHDKYNQNFETTICNVGKYRSNNYDGPVMNSIYEKIRGFTDDNIIFIVISDGHPCNWGSLIPPVEDMKRIIEKCKRDGFVTMGIGVQSYHVKDIYPYNTIVNDMQNEFVKKVSFLVNHVVKTEFQS